MLFRSVTYDPSLPQSSDGVQSMVRRQDQAASTMFVYHLAGLGLEAWDYTKPENSDNDCVRSIWRMVCYTYFPRAKLGCQVGLPTQYTRPCQSSCHNYIRQCGVECCDESVQCVFEHERPAPGGDMVKTEGYVAHSGPSSLCTGAASSQSLGLALALIAGRGSMRGALDGTTGRAMPVRPSGRREASGSAT